MIRRVKTQCNKLSQSLQTLTSFNSNVSSHSHDQLISNLNISSKFLANNVWQTFKILEPSLIDKSYTYNGGIPQYSVGISKQHSTVSIHFKHTDLRWHDIKADLQVTHQPIKICTNSNKHNTSIHNNHNHNDASNINISNPVTDESVNVNTISVHSGILQLLTKNTDTYDDIYKNLIDLKEAGLYNRDSDEIVIHGTSLGGALSLIFFMQTLFNGDSNIRNKFTDIFPTDFNKISVLTFGSPLVVSSKDCINIKNKIDENMYNRIFNFYTPCDPIPLSLGGAQTNSDDTNGASISDNGPSRNVEIVKDICWSNIPFFQTLGTNYSIGRNYLVFQDRITEMNDEQMKLYINSGNKLLFGAQNTHEKAVAEDSMNDLPEIECRNTIQFGWLMNEYHMPWVYRRRIENMINVNN